MDFGEVLSRAWKIIWKHKILWVFGIFAGCSRGGGGGGNGGGGGGNPGRPFNNPGGAGGEFQQFANQFSNWIQSHWWVVVLFVIAVLVLVLVTILLGTIGRIGLIKGTQKADAGAEHLGFAELWDESLPYFWRIFLLSLLIGLASFVVVLILIAVGIGFTVITLGVGLLCLIPLICIFALALAFVGLVVQQAESAIVVENLGIMDGLRRGWDVTRRNIGPILIMWLILAVIGFVGGLAIAIPIIAIVVPAAIGFAAANSQGGTNLSYAPLIIAGACFVVYFPFLLALNGILMAYLQSAWTLTYLRLTQPKDHTNIESPVLPAPNA